MDTHARFGGRRCLNQQYIPISTQSHVKNNDWDRERQGGGVF